MRKYLIILLTLISIIGVAIFTNVNGWGYITSNFVNSEEHEIIKLESGDAVVFSFAKKIDAISFSKDSGFTIRALEGGQWIDMSNNPSDFEPMKGYLVRNYGEGDLTIDATYSTITKVEDTLFQKTLKAGWNLVGVANQSDDDGLVLAKYGLGESLPYSQLVDFSPEGIININNGVYSRDTYSGEVQINPANAWIINPNIENPYTQETYVRIKNKSEIENSYLQEKLAYGVFVNSDTIMAGSQDLSSSNQTNNELASFAVQIQEASDSSNFGITAINGNGQTITDYNGTVNITSTNQNIVFTGELADNQYTFTNEDQGSISLANVLNFNDYGDYTINIENQEQTVNTNDNRIITPEIQNVILDTNDAFIGQQDVTLNQFNINNYKSVDVGVNTIKVRLYEVVESGSTLAYTDLNPGEILKVSVYKNEVSSGTLLAETNTIDSNGYANLNTNDTMIASEISKYIVTVDFADDINLAGKMYKASLTNVEFENTNNEIVEYVDIFASLEGLLGGADLSKVITLKQYGEVSLIEDQSNVDNENVKTILAGESSVIFSADIQAINEEVNIGKVVFNVDQDLKAAVASASLYLDNTLIATNTNADITSTTITFDNLPNLVIPTQNSELRLELNTTTIGYQKVGETIINAKVTGVSTELATGVNSGKTITDQNISVTGTDFSILPTLLIPVITQQLSNGQAKIQFYIDYGNNTVDTSNATPTVTLNDLVFSEYGNNTDGYTINVEGDNSTQGTISSSGVLNKGTLTTDNLTISDTKVYVITPNATLNSTYTLNLDSMNYDINGISNSSNIIIDYTLELGSRTY